MMKILFDCRATRSPAMHSFASTFFNTEIFVHTIQRYLRYFAGKKNHWRRHKVRSRKNVLNYKIAKICKKEKKKKIESTARETPRVIRELIFLNEREVHARYREMKYFHIIWALSVVVVFTSFFRFFFLFFANSTRLKNRFSLSYQNNNERATESSWMSWNVSEKKQKRKHF